MATPNECIVYVWLKDIGGVDASITNATLYAQNKRAFRHGTVAGSVYTILPFTKSQAFETLGGGTYSEIQLIETTTPGERINFSIVINDGGTLKQIFFKPAIVPNSTSTNLLSITEVLDE